MSVAVCQILIWINSLRVANMFGLWCWPRSVLDIDDIPSNYELTRWRNGDRLMDRLKGGARAPAPRRVAGSLNRT
jgi:hypothetical protein